MHSCVKSNLKGFGGSLLCKPYYCDIEDNSIDDMATAEPEFGVAPECSVCTQAYSLKCNACTRK